MLNGKSYKSLKNGKRKKVSRCGPCDPYPRLCKTLCPENLKSISATM